MPKKIRTIYLDGSDMIRYLEHGKTRTVIELRGAPYAALEKALPGTPEDNYGNVTVSNGYDAFKLTRRGNDDPKVKLYVDGRRYPFYEGRAYDTAEEPARGYERRQRRARRGFALHNS